MDLRFKEVVDSLHPKYEALIRCPSIKAGQFPKDLPLAGVYLFSDNGKPLYVGRTGKIKGRYGGHTLPSSKHYSAPFAFKLACKATGTPSLAKDREFTRDQLMEQTEFKAAFLDAKRKIREMDFRYVAECVPVRQALLEAYCCIVLDTPYNDFDNH